MKDQVLFGAAVVSVVVATGSATFFLTRAVATLSSDGRETDTARVAPPITSLKQEDIPNIAADSPSVPETGSENTGNSPQAALPESPQVPSPTPDPRDADRVIEKPIPKEKTEAELVEHGLSTRERQEILALHNASREEVGVADLHWSNALSESAARWADTLTKRDCVIDHSGGPYGENIYYSMKYGELSPRTAHDVMGALTEELSFYDYKSNTCASGEICGHYTQIVWSTTKSVGCAKRLCLSLNKREEVWVCHYDPPGNVEGVRPY